MVQEKNKAIVSRFLEEIHQGNLDIIEELISPNYIDWTALPTQPTAEPRGRDIVAHEYATFVNAFPDLHVDIEYILAEGDRVVLRGKLRGTHQGEFLGLAPTGRQATWTGTHCFRVEDGQLMEGWIDIDMVTMLMQLGVSFVQPGGDPHSAA